MLGIFPASGGIGGSTLKHLLNNVSGSSLTAIVRKPENVPDRVVKSGCIVRSADYDKIETLGHAFDGIKILNLISYASIDHEHRSKVSAIWSPIFVISPLYFRRREAAEVSYTNNNFFQ